MGEALKVLVGPEAEGLSASTVSRLKQVWAQEYHDWCEGRLDPDRWVYVWADGVYSGLRAEQARLCALVVIGVNERDEKHTAKPFIKKPPYKSTHYIKCWTKVFSNTEMSLKEELVYTPGKE